MLPEIQLALIAMFGAGAITMTYGSIAAERGWLVGRMMVGPKPALAVLALVSVLASLALSFVVGPWWRFLITLVGGFTVSSVLIPLLRGLVQPLAVLGMLASWIWTYVAFGARAV